MVTFPGDDSPACTDSTNAVCAEDAAFYDLALNYAYNHSFMHTGSVETRAHNEPSAKKEKAPPYSTRAFA